MPTLSNILNICQTDQAIRYTSCLILAVGLLSATLSFADPTEPTSTQNTRVEQRTPKGPPKDISQIPLPKARGFWGTFFFWSGGVFCMYLVGRRVFKEQAHERHTLKRFRDEIGHFFPEFDPLNIKRWVEIATPHLYHSWREGDFSTMKSFTSESLINTQMTELAKVNIEGRKRIAHFDKVIAVHTLGAAWSSSIPQMIKHPPLGVELTLRVEVKAIDFVEDAQGELVSGKKKPNQHQLIWRLTHNGKTWRLDEVYSTEDEITDLANLPPLPPIGEWRRPESLNEQQAIEQDSDIT